MPAAADAGELPATVKGTPLGKVRLTANAFEETTALYKNVIQWIHRHKGQGLQVRKAGETVYRERALTTSQAQVHTLHGVPIPLGFVPSCWRLGVESKETILKMVEPIEPTLASSTCA